MNLRIAGMGWITPLGSGVEHVWTRLLNRDEAAASEIKGPFPESDSHVAMRVPSDAMADLPVHPRLRRASAISKFAVAAGMAALKELGSTVEKDVVDRTALIFAVANGGVTYTKRFYHDIVETGASAASPLLFPETVFNAPASHLASVLGLTGASYTLVSDGAVGILAIEMARDLIENGSCDYCLVVGTEEADWVLCDAYDRWRLTRSKPPIEPFQTPPRGTILSEGAGAIVLAREGNVTIAKVDGGGDFARQTEAVRWVAKVTERLVTPETKLIVSSANGTFVDEAEMAAFQELEFRGAVYSPKPALGESVGASGLWQVIVGAQALRTKSVPPMLHVIAERGKGFATDAGRLESGEAVVLDCGLNQQIAGLRLTANG